LGLVIGYVLLSNAIDTPRGVRWSLGWDIAFLTLVGAIAVVHRSKLGEALSWRSFTAKDMVTALMIQAVLTTSVMLLAKWMTGQGVSFHDSCAVYRDSSHPYVLALLSIAIFPALTEELAFRGILFAQLERLTTRNGSILVTGFLFAWTHFSFLSLIWLVPAGLFFGWMRARYNTIWYGVVCHFAHNATIVFVDM
jgi:membrane protease YdiL (CAAX protease family)